MNDRKKVTGEEARSQLQVVTFSNENNTFSGLKKNPHDNYDALESYKKLRKRRVKIACFRMAIWCLIVLLVPIFVFLSITIVAPNTGHNFFGYTFYIVASESMTPEIKVNDCIVVERIGNEGSIKVGDDITFIRKLDGQVVTHRVISITTNENGELCFITKGVHNLNADPELVSFSNVVGKRILTIGWLGQIIMFFRTAYGIITFVALLGLVLLLFFISFRMSDDIRAVGK